MELKKAFKDLVKYGSQNEKNRKEVVEASAWIIAILTQNEGKKITEQDLNSISAGWLGCRSNLSFFK